MASNEGRSSQLQDEIKDPNIKESQKSASTSFTDPSPALQSQREIQSGRLPPTMPVSTPPVKGVSSEKKRRAGTKSMKRNPFVSTMPGDASSRFLDSPLLPSTTSGRKRIHSKPETGPEESEKRQRLSNTESNPRVGTSSESTIHQAKKVIGSSGRKRKSEMISKSEEAGLSSPARAESSLSTDPKKEKRLASLLPRDTALHGDDPAMTSSAPQTVIGKKRPHLEPVKGPVKRAKRRRTSGTAFEGEGSSGSKSTSRQETGPGESEKWQGRSDTESVSRVGTSSESTIHQVEKVTGSSGRKRKSEISVSISKSEEAGLSTPTRAESSLSTDPKEKKKRLASTLPRDTAAHDDDPATTSSAPQTVISRKRQHLEPTDAQTIHDITEPPESTRLPLSEDFQKEFDHIMELQQYIVFVFEPKYYLEMLKYFETQKEFENHMGILIGSSRAAELALQGHERSGNEQTRIKKINYSLEDPNYAEQPDMSKEYCFIPNDLLERYDYNDAEQVMELADGLIRRILKFLRYIPNFDGLDSPPSQGNDPSAEESSSNKSNDDEQEPHIQHSSTNRGPLLQQNLMNIMLIQAAIYFDPGCQVIRLHGNGQSRFVFHLETTHLGCDKEATQIIGKFLMEFNRKALWDKGTMVLAMLIRLYSNPPPRLDAEAKTVIKEKFQHYSQLLKMYLKSIYEFKQANVIYDGVTKFLESMDQKLQPLHEGFQQFMEKWNAFNDNT